MAPRKECIIYFIIMLIRYGGTNRYSDVVVHNNVAYLSGIVPTDLSNNIIGQTYEVLNTLDRLLDKIGSSKQLILSMTIYLKDALLYDDMNLAFDNWIQGSPPPARATIGIVSFPNPRWLIEIVVTASVRTSYNDLSGNRTSYNDLSGNYSIINNLNYII
jgi:enamine deaminase RidA (YjgF/YER057c/UK114 family)